MTFTYTYLAALARNMADTDATADEERQEVAGATPPAADRDALAAALLSPDAHLAEHLRDARLTINPCEHWVGQEIAVCSPCLRDRIVPHIVDVALAARPAPDTVPAGRLRAQEDRVRAALADIGHLKQAQRELMALGVGLDDSGRILSGVKRAHADSVVRALLADHQPAAGEEGRG